MPDLFKNIPGFSQGATHPGLHDGMKGPQCWLVLALPRTLFVQTVAN